MKKALCLLLTVCLLTGLSTAAFAGTHREGKPWVNPELPGNLPDERPAPEEDFYLYVNYDLHRKAADEPDAQINYAARVDQYLKDAVWNLINNGESVEARSLRILTSLMLDRERREKEGPEPLLAYFRRVRETKTVEELSALCREEGFLCGSPYAQCGLGPSEQDPEKFALTIQITELVPSVTPEDGSEAGGDDRPDTGKVEGELALLGYAPESARQLTERIVNYQNQYIAGLMTDADLADLGNAKPLTAAEIREICTPLYDQLLSQGFIRESGPDEAIYQIVMLPSFRYVQNQYTNENLDLFQAIVGITMLRYASDYLDPATYAKAHQIDGEADLKTAADEYLLLHARNLAEQAYAGVYISSAQRAEVRKLAEECRQALEERLSRCEWLSEESRKKAAEKASMIQVTIVGPEEPFDYEPLLKTLSEENISLLQAAIRYDRTEHQLLLRAAGTAYDRGLRLLYDDSMLKPDAIYEPGKNTFYLMAGILQPEFYNGASRETLLATIGQTIAHEMGHGFDARGIQYDGKGGYASPLTEEDLKKYQEKAMHLVENLNGIELTDSTRLDGQKKLTEETADLIAVRVVLDLAAKTEGFDYDLFFRTLAGKFFRSFKTREDAIDNFESDLHPPYYIRTNYTIAQFDEFYRTYPAVREGTGMYYAPEKRESLW